MLAFPNANIKSRHGVCRFSSLSLFFLLFCERQDLRPIGCYGERMLGVCRRLLVSRHHRPAVRKCLGLSSAQIQHGLDRETITCPDGFAGAGPAVVRDLWGFMHLPPDTMARVIANYAVTKFFSVLLYSPADVTDTIANPALFNAELKALIGDSYQLL